MTNTGSIEISDVTYPDATAIVAPIQRAVEANPAGAGADPCGSGGAVEVY